MTARTVAGPLSSRRPDAGPTGAERAVGDCAVCTSTTTPSAPPGGSRATTGSSPTSCPPTALVPTAIAGIYGMNFDHMPELGWRYGYPAVLVTIVTVCGVLAWLFRRNGWL